MNLIGIADFLHLASIVLLLAKIKIKRRCDAVSLKSLILYLTCYILRYVNPWIFKGSFVSILFKLAIISLYAYLIYLVRFKFYKTYEEQRDTLYISIIYALSILCALIFGPKLRFEKVFIWTFFHAVSLWIEAFGILPQIILLRRSSKTNIIQVDYIFLLSLYRMIYFMYWLYSYITSTRVQTNLIVSSLIQTIIFSDFIVVYIYFKMSNKEFELPY